MKPDLIHSVTLDELIILDPQPMPGSAGDGEGHQGDDSFDDSADTGGEAFSAADGTFDHVVNLADLDHDLASGMMGTFLPCSPQLSWDGVKGHNAEHGPLFDPATVDDDLRAMDLSILAFNFIKQCDPELIVHLLKRHDHDESLRFLADPFLDYFDHHYHARSGTFSTPAFNKERAYYAALELLTLGLHREPGQSLCGFGNNNFASVLNCAREKRVELGKLREDRLKALALEVYWDHRSQFSSPTRHKEQDLLLAPAEKARVFMNGLRERNDAGILVTTYHRNQRGVLVAIGMRYERLLIFHREDQARIEELFEYYRGTSAKDLLTILDRCIQVHVEGAYYGDDDKHEAFHAEKGRIIAFFADHLQKIAKELKTRYAFDYPSLLTP